MFFFYSAALALTDFYSSETFERVILSLEVRDYFDWGAALFILACTTEATALKLLLDWICLVQRLMSIFNVLPQALYLLTLDMML